MEHLENNFPITVVNPYNRDCKKFGDQEGFKIMRKLKTIFYIKIKKSMKNVLRPSQPRKFFSTIIFAFLKKYHSSITYYIIIIIIVGLHYYYNNNLLILLKGNNSKLLLTLQKSNSIISTLYYCIRKIYLPDLIYTVYIQQLFLVINFL